LSVPKIHVIGFRFAPCRLIHQNPAAKTTLSITTTTTVWNKLFQKLEEVF
jgi:hypothetical protein